MKRSEYLETIDGQWHEWNKRRLRTNWLSIDQEPKSKSAQSVHEKKAFRASIKSQLERRRRRAHTGDIVLEIDFGTTQKNPPAIHTLVKNYLDLLHKPLPEIDDLKGILFKDDSQIKVLLAHYDMRSADVKPRIRIRSQSLSNFVKDLILADRVIKKDFPDADRVVLWAVIISSP